MRRYGRAVPGTRFRVAAGGDPAATVVQDAPPNDLVDVRGPEEEAVPETGFAEIEAPTTINDFVARAKKADGELDSMIRIDDNTRSFRKTLLGENPDPPRDPSVVRDQAVNAVKNAATLNCGSGVPVEQANAALAKLPKTEEEAIEAIEKSEDSILDGENDLLSKSTMEAGTEDGQKKPKAKKRRSATTETAGTNEA